MLGLRDTYDKVVAWICLDMAEYAWICLGAFGYVNDKFDVLISLDMFELRVIGTCITLCRRVCMCVSVCEAGAR